MTSSDIRQLQCAVTGTLLQLIICPGLSGSLSCELPSASVVEANAAVTTNATFYFVRVHAYIHRSVVQLQHLMPGVIEK